MTAEHVQDRQTSAELLRRVKLYEALGFGAMFLVLMLDDGTTIFDLGTAPVWEVLEIAAAIGVGTLTLVLTNRLFARIQLLEGLISICMHCKRVKSEGAWVSVERYVSARSAATFSHGLCPDCFAREYPDPKATAGH